MPQARLTRCAGGIENLVPPTYGMLCAEVDLERVRIARRSLDVAAHCALPDLVVLPVQRRPQQPVREG